MMALRKIDPMVRLLIVAIALAAIVPVKGELRDIAQAIANAAVFLLFFLYGLKLSRAEVWAGLGNHRLLVPLVAWVFAVMPAAGWVIWKLGMGFAPANLALGFLYLGVLPSTIQSAVIYVTIARGNTAASVVAAALVNVMGVVVSAPLFSLLAGRHGIAFHGDTLIKVLSMLLLPFVLGQLLQGFAGGWIRSHKSLTTLLDRGSIGIAVYVACSGAVAQGLWDMISLADWGYVLVGCAALLVVGYGGAWLASGQLGLERGDRISMTFAGAQKSAAMGAPLATVLFPPAMAGVVIVPLLTYHLLQMMVAAPIAGRMSRAGQEEAVASSG